MAARASLAEAAMGLSFYLALDFELQKLLLYALVCGTCFPGSSFPSIGDLGQSWNTVSG